VLLVLLIIPVALEPWAEKKIQDKFNDKVRDYRLDIGKLNISIIKRGVELENITLSSKQEKEGVAVLKGEITSVRIKGVKLLKAIFRQDIEIFEVTVSDSRIAGEFHFPGKAVNAKISPLNITIDRLILDNFSLELKSDSTAQAYLIRDGFIYFQYLKVEKSDTLSPVILKQFDFDAKELKTVTSDSLYTIAALGINYSAVSKTLSVSNFAIQPNYTDYEFTSRHQFESDRIDAELSQISFHDFSAEDFIKSGNLTGSYIEVGEIGLKAFRDKREEFRHVNKPTLQELIYSYPGTIDIDSVGILNGSITYVEHAEGANEPGMIRFDELKAMIYKISNDTLYKTKEGYLELKAEALLMGKGKANVFLKGRIFDRENTFEMHGTLSAMEAMEMNPILEKNAFLYVTSGNIETMNFSFAANNTRATGNMQLNYKGLNLTIKNKHTDDTTAFKEQLISMIANMKIMDSNPMPGEELRTGVIYYERDPEKFLFNYFVKSIMSGITSSLVRNPKESKK
jgi:hypothetical protein